MRWAVLSLGLVLVAGASGAEEGSVPDAEAADSVPALAAQLPPTGVIAAQTLVGARFAVGYAYETSRFDEMRDERERIRARELLAVSGYTSAPSRHEVERHEIALLYAPRERVTLVASLPFYRKEMRNETASGRFTTRSSGVGDLGLTLITRFMQHDFEQTFFHLELGAPTGSIRARDHVGTGMRERLPYRMQLGSGVWHLAPGLTYQGHVWRYTWGGQARTLFRLARNELGYRPGHHYRVTGWLGREWLDGLATSLRLEWHRWGNVKGQDPALDLDATPVNDPMLQKGERLDLGIGLDVRLPYLDSQSLQLEATLPLWERLDGPQPSFDWGVRAGWRWAL